MGKGLGIAALVLMLISFPIPIVGTWIGYLALVVAALAVLVGNKPYAIATVVIGAIKMYFLSPGLMASMYYPFAAAEGVDVPLENYLFLFLTTFFAVLPLLALAFRPALRGLLSSFGLHLSSNEG
ncbi:MAG: hypothetical protein AAFO77_08195 [Pseudomonadota bacterium]